MIRFASAGAVWILVLSGCSRLRESYPPPVQRESAASELGHVVAMSDSNAGAYIAGGFREQSDGPWRWTTPVTLAISINGRQLDRARYDKPGEQQYTHEVPAELLQPNGIKIVAINPDKVAEPNPGEKLAFVLIRAGFAE